MSFLLLLKALYKKVLFRGAQCGMPDWSKEVTVVNRQNNDVLMNQTISKLLDYRSEGVPKDSDLLNLLQPTTQKSPDYADTFAEDTGQDSQ